VRADVQTHYLVAGADTGKTELDAAQKNGVTVNDHVELESYGPSSGSSLRKLCQIVLC